MTDTAFTPDPDDPWLGCDPTHPDYQINPYPRLKRLRELDPVNQTPLGVWRLTRYADVVRLLRDVPTGVRTTDGRLPNVDESEFPRRFMLQQDPPTHTRLRRLVSRAFTPRAVQHLRESVERVVAECLAEVAQRADARGRGELDLIADLALPVPATVICEMLGVPASDRDRFTGWTADATHGLAASAPPDVAARARAAGMALAGYFQERIAERRGQPGDDILAELIRAEEEGDRLSTEEMISQSIGLLIAGFETTIGLIGNGVRALIQHPLELEKLRARPELIESAVEECLRFDGPIPLTLRILHEDTEFGDKKLPCNAEVMAMLASANRDPERFPDPDRFDIERRENPHLAFGGGTHMCLGAHLARMEAQLAIGGFVQAFRHLELETETPTFGRSLFRVPEKLSIRFQLD